MSGELTHSAQLNAQCCFTLFWKKEKLAPNITQWESAVSFSCSLLLLFLHFPVHSYCCTHIPACIPGHIQHIFFSCKWFDGCGRGLNSSQGLLVQDGWSSIHRVGCDTAGLCGFFVLSTGLHKNRFIAALFRQKLKTIKLEIYTAISAFF